MSCSGRRAEYAQSPWAGAKAGGGRVPPERTVEELLLLERVRRRDCLDGGVFFRLRGARVALLMCLYVCSTISTFALEQAGLHIVTFG
jgi:hypothetical protein